MVDNVYTFENYTDQPAVTDDGTGTDWIVITGTYAAQTSGRGLRDLIEDFTSGQDHIDLHRIAKGQVFIGTANFHNIAKEVRYDPATGLLAGDTDGNGSADYQIALGTGTVLTATDLIL